MKTIYDEILADLYRYTGQVSNRNLIKYFIKDYRFRYMVCWRLAKETFPLSAVWKFFLRSLRKHYQLEIPYSVEIGQGFSMDHASGITINSNAKLGKNVTLYKGATIGSTLSPDGTRKAPVIGNEVYIGLNSTIVGGG